MQQRAIKQLGTFWNPQITLLHVQYFIRQSTGLFENPQHEFEAAIDGDSGKLIAIKQVCEIRWACSNKGSGGKCASNSIEDERLHPKTAADSMHQFKTLNFS